MDMLSAHNLILALTAIILIFAAGNDAARFRIPNVASLAILILFPLYALVAPTPIDWVGHAIAFAVTLVAGYGLYAKNLAGAGDIKLLAVIALWAGLEHWGVFLFVTAIAGGILSLGIGAMSFLRHRLSQSKDGLVLSKTPIPYGVAIAVGGLCTLVLLSHPDLLHMQTPG